MPFYKNLTKPIRTIALQMGVCCLFFIMLGYGLVSMGLINAGGGDLVTTLFVMVGYFYFRKTVNDGHQKRNFIFCIGIYAGGLAHGSMHVVNGMEFWGPEITTAQAVLIDTAIFICIYLVVGFILHRIIAVRMQRVKPKDMDWMWVIPFLFSILTYLYIVGNNLIGINDAGINTFFFPVVFIMLSIISFVVFIIVIRMLEKAGINAQLELDAATANERQRSLEKENASLEALAQIKTAFLQDIKHEARNPLLAISLGVDYVKEYFEPKGNAEEAEKVLATVQNEALRLGRMINGMVELATTEGGETARQKVNFAEVIKSFAGSSKLLLDKNQNSLKIQIPDDSLFVYGESEQLGRVINNLIDNANDSAKGGTISIETSTESNYIIVRIRDNGSGIDSKLIPHVFERGISSKGSDGYGLSMCKTIVEAHGGNIRIASGNHQADAGSENVITIPKAIDGTEVIFTIPIYSGQRN